LRPTRTQLEKLLGDRLDFLIGVGHDMRVPLGGIVGFASILAERDSVRADPTALEAIAYVRQEASRLVELLDQLLAFGRVERARGGQPTPVLDLEPLDLGRLARQAMEPWAALRPDLTLRLVGAGEVTIEGDFLQLHRVLSNLLDNAVRHSPPQAGITVEVRRGAEGAEVAVSDEGPGIPEADRERVFQRFVRLGDSRSGGSGIGLYIVKGLVEAHGGKVRVEESDPGGGARFVVSLPLRTAEPAEAVEVDGVIGF
jgi:two-component system OmpR family sensor kinase